MLKIIIPASEYFNDATGEFQYFKEQTLLLEHSLMSISKWESRWKKPFLDEKNPKTKEETIDYIRCMTISKGVDPAIYYSIPSSAFAEINKYIEDPMTATWFNERNVQRSREIVTAEIIYYWMTVLHIPFECEKWHLNKLMTLIKVCSLKRDGGKKMSKREISASNRSLNEARKKALHSKG